MPEVSLKDIQEMLENWQDTEISGAVLILGDEKDFSCYVAGPVEGLLLDAMNKMPNFAEALMKTTYAYLQLKKGRKEKSTFARAKEYLGNRLKML